jgi:hypothetical protein
MRMHSMSARVGYPDRARETHNTARSVDRFESLSVRGDFCLVASGWCSAFWLRKCTELNLCVPPPARSRDADEKHSRIWRPLHCCYEIGLLLENLPIQVESKLAPFSNSTSFLMISVIQSGRSPKCSRSTSVRNLLT